MEKIHRERDLELRARHESDTRFLGEQQDLEEMIGNLVDNACKWARTQVEVIVLAADPAFGGRPFFRIAVEDDGPGLPHEARQEVLTQRGRRLDESKPGSGLGLSIVSDLAHLYDGRLELSAAHLGGLRAELVLPAAET
jgi:signal transduction histidine kinase